MSCDSVTGEERRGAAYSGTQDGTNTKNGTPAAPIFRALAGSAVQQRLPWAELLRRVLGVEFLRCQSGKPIRVLAAITQPTVAKRILECMGLPPRAPPLEPARPSGFASEPWLDETEAAGFDQSPSEDWDPGA